ncbi:MAG: OmpA family protein [Pseudomonadaceae bacterium]
MSQYNGLKPGEVLADASVAEFISSLGLGIAKAQQALDANSIEQLDSFITPIPGLGGKTLIEMGFSPAFYHYQHADISCSMNLRLKVEENSGWDLGINAAYDGNFGNEASSESSETNSESGTRNETRTREAKLQITSQSAGEVVVNNERIGVSGADLEARLNNLVDALAGNADIDAVAFDRTETPINPTSNASAALVECTPNAVAFKTFGYACGFIRIAANSATDFVVNPDITVQVPVSNSIRNYARKVKTHFEDAGFNARLFPPGFPIENILFDINRANIRADQLHKLQEVALLLARSSLHFKIVGHADPPATADYNLDLSLRRANEVKRQMIRMGVQESQITTTTGEGEISANPEDREGLPYDQAHRRVEILLDIEMIRVDAHNGQPISGVSPDRRDGSEPSTNGWIHTFDSQTLTGVNGKTVTAEGQTWELSGAAIDGLEADSPQAFAKNLSNSINADGASQIAASASGAICNLARETDPVSLRLITRSSRDVRVSSSESITVTEQFERTSAQRETQRRTGNHTVAVGATFSMHESKKFELEVTGNSSISARLVSIPAPPEFLETIRTFLEE